MKHNRFDVAMKNRLSRTAIASVLIFAGIIVGDFFAFDYWRGEDLARLLFPLIVTPVALWLIWWSS